MWRRPLEGLLPLVLTSVLLWFSLGDGRPLEGVASYPSVTVAGGRVVFVMVDSLTDRMVLDEEVLPALQPIRPRAALGKMHGCLPASTVPCTRTMFEGSNAGYVEGLHNFAARRGSARAFPSVAAAAGLRVAVASDHTMIRMFEHIGGPRLDLGARGIARYSWDEAAVDAVELWLRGHEADVVLVHLIDLDKASHDPGPNTPRYVQEIRDLDSALARIIAALEPGDTLIVAGDHGHDEHGSHTPDPGYLAFGPPFAPGRADIRQETVALLLSVSAGTDLMGTYEGEVPSQLLARPIGGSPAAAAQIRSGIERRTQARGRLQRTMAMWSIPALLAGLWLAVTMWGPARAGRMRVAQRVLLAGGLLVVNMVVAVAWFGWVRPRLVISPAVSSLWYGGGLVSMVLATGWVRGQQPAEPLTQAVGLSLAVVPLALHLPGDENFGLVTMAPRLWGVVFALLLAADVRAGRRRWWWLAPIVVVAAWRSLPTIAWAEQPVVRAAAVAVASAAVIATTGVDRKLALVVCVVFALLAGPFVLGAGPVVALGALVAVVGRVGRNLDCRASTTPMLFALTAVVAYALCLATFRFDAVRFEFGFAWFPYIKHEGALAALVAPLTVVKYGLPLFLLGMVWPNLGRLLATRTVLALAATALLVAAFVLGLVIDGSSRLHEVVIQETIMLVALTLAAALALGAAVWFRVRREAAGATEQLGPGRQPS